MKPTKKQSYEKPLLTRHENLINVTFECSSWQCSVVVPTTHPAGP